MSSSSSASSLTPRSQARASSTRSRSGRLASSSSSSTPDQGQRRLRAGRLGGVVRHRGPVGDGRDVEPHAGVLEDPDDAGGAFVRRRLQLEPVDELGLGRVAADGDRPGVGRVGQHRPQRDHEPSAELVAGGEDLGAELPPAHVGLDAADQDHVAVELRGRGDGDLRGGPGDPAVARSSAADHRPVDLEVVEVLGVDRADDARVPHLIRWSTTPVAASAASFQPSKAAMTSGIDQVVDVLDLDHLPSVVRLAAVARGFPAGRRAVSRCGSGVHLPGRRCLSSSRTAGQRPREPESTGRSQVTELRGRAPARRHRRADRACCAERILVIDGAMGTAIQRDRPSEATYRGERFADWPSDLQGNNDLLVDHPARTSSRPSTASTSRPAPTSSRPTPSTPTRSRWPTTAWTTSPARSTARPPGWPGGSPTRSSAQTPDQPRYVAGAIGPTTRTASISPDVNDPGARNVTFDELVAAYPDAGRTAWSRAAPTSWSSRPSSTPSTPRRRSSPSRRCSRSTAAAGRSSSPGTITDASGRTLSGQVTEAFWASVRHARPLAVGLNCALGATEMRPYIAELSRIADSFVSCYPNAGLPNAFGEYDEPPRRPRAVIGEFGEAGFLNLVGGCCGTTPGAHRAPSPRRWRAHAGARCPRSADACGSPGSSRSRSPRTASS